MHVQSKFDIDTAHSSIFRCIDSNYSSSLLVILECNVIPTGESRHQMLKFRQEVNQEILSCLISCDFDKSDCHITNAREYV